MAQQTNMENKNRENKKHFMMGRPYQCPICGFVPPQIASHKDYKRGIVCNCPVITVEFPTEDSEKPCQS